jgi:F-type H+-transporting ATPase subunit c
MRKLQYLFMTLSALFMAVPAFAQTPGGEAGGPGHGLTAIAAGLGMGIAAGYGSAGPQSWSARRHPATAHPRPGVYGVTLPLHAGHHFRQGSILIKAGNPASRRDQVTPDLFLL